MSRLGETIFTDVGTVVHLRDTKTPPLSVITLLDALVIIARQNIGRKSRFLPQLGGLRRNIAITLGTEKLEWCGYPMVKKF